MTSKKYMAQVTFMWKDRVLPDWRICDKILETRNGQFFKLEFTTFYAPDTKNELEERCVRFHFKLLQVNLYKKS